MARVNIDLTGIAGEFLEKIPLKKKGIVVSVLVAKTISSGIAREVLSPLFTKDDIDDFMIAWNPNHESITESLKPEVAANEPIVDSKDESKNDFKVKL
ncbi:hypothetical protein [Sulfurospirillum multivorans]|uniref:Uncharacterized protein n=2 Tax=Sulfurospirillum multivorans TaxID=66821 RepID=A0AA86AM43_SULMK|nr:hypothetical protein [Sulfurospirillum multivorans]AHJ12999.1 hypothetical protein SMUL_1744 [Sulfurospirillum multivorans DSM 12446]QEH06489.1 hypothetical protein SMN_1724 [Sulfurospirillum multivorans]